MQTREQNRKPGHVVAEADRRRVRCIGGQALRCGKPSYWCQYVYGSQGATSFYYYCKKHAKGLPGVPKGWYASKKTQHKLLPAERGTKTNPSRGSGVSFCPTCGRDYTSEPIQKGTCSCGEQIHVV